MTREQAKIELTKAYRKAYEQITVLSPSIDKEMLSRALHTFEHELTETLVNFTVAAANRQKGKDSHV